MLLLLKQKEKVKLNMLPSLYLLTLNHFIREGDNRENYSRENF